MKKYKVIWNDEREMKSGCVTVYAKSEMQAVAKARDFVQIGNGFRVLGVYEGR